MNGTPTFELTPRNSSFRSLPSEVPYFAAVEVRGVDLLAKYPVDSPRYRHSFDHQHAQDQVLFAAASAGDPLVDYRDWRQRILVPYVRLRLNLESFGAQRELALVFGFEALESPPPPHPFSGEPRVLIHTGAEQVGDVTLAVGDNQFLVQVESLEWLVHLYFLHVKSEGYSWGGSWFFRGITGYVV